MNKPFTLKFELNSKLIALLYICYKYKFPLSFMLSFYELYGDKSLFVIKAMACTSKLNMSDAIFINIIQESRSLYKEILSGVSTLLKINQLKKDKADETTIPDEPNIDTTKFSSSFKDFIENYLMKNIKNIYAETVSLKCNTRDLYEEIN